ncbi:hypothetical protein MHH70_12445 [Metasolibacillus sp. FSL H7-0170]|uniref:hypothetical protein n=1 Tax=Metasolibacillus sp. FSL H7-0170 TaxID=2921431 RepID=UPI0031597A0B
MNMQLYRLRFKTAHKTADDVKKEYSFDPPSPERLGQIAEAYRNLDGIEVIGAAWEHSPESYSLYDWSDNADEKMKEFIYMQEQDEFFGNYIGQRGRFETDWVRGAYEPSGAMHFDKADFEIVELLKSVEVND